MWYRVVSLLACFQLFEFAAAGDDKNVISILKYQPSKGEDEQTIVATASIEGRSGFGAVLPDGADDALIGDIAEDIGDGFGCEAISQNLDGAIALLNRGKNCTFKMKALHAQSAGASMVVIVNTDNSSFLMADDASSKAVISIPVVMVGQSDGAKLRSAAAQGYAALTAYMYTRPLFDIAFVVMFCIAVGVVMTAAWWAGSDVRDAKRRRALGLPSPRRSYAQEDHQYISMSSAASFILVASGSLLVLFFFLDYAIYVVIAFFAIGATTSMHAVLTDVTENRFYRSFPLWRETKVLCGDIEATKFEMLTFVPCVAVTVVWVFVRKASWAWMLQDVMSIALCLTLQKTVRLPNIKISTVLLCAAFLYDIFWVFISPYFFTSSVMVTVATGGTSGEVVPVVIKLPRFSDELGGTTILGLGDIALPGLLVSYLYRFDQIKGLEGTNGYFLFVSFMYALGIALTDIALVIMKMGQPALLYIVPTTLGGTLALAAYRGHLKEMWGGGVSEGNDVTNGDGRGERDGNTSSTDEPLLSSNNETYSHAEGAELI